MRWQCRWGFHIWGNWGEKFTLKNTGYLFEYQQRKCECCGFIDERRI